MITQKELDEIRELVRKTVLGHLASLGKEKLGGQVVVNVGVDYIFPPVPVEVNVTKGTMAKMLEKRGKLFTVDRPLTKEEWKMLESLSWPKRLREVFDYFRKNGNKVVKGEELVRLGVLASNSGPTEQFNQFLRTNRVACGLRSNQYAVGGSWTYKSYRIFPLSSIKDAK